MKVIHTSPVKIEKIIKNGMFNDCLFFSRDRYVMTQSNIVHTYEIELDEDKVINVSNLHDNEIITHIAEVLNINEDDAERVLDGRDTAFNHGGNAEDDWWIQAKQGECAKKMGFDACESEDEQGTVYIVPMFRKEKLLKLL